MVKSLKRNFITVLLLVCVIFSLILPIAAVETTTTTTSVQEQVYNRVKWIGTEAMQPIKDVVEAYTGVYSGLADGLYDAYLEVFRNGGTDQQGNVVSGSVPITDSSGFTWYPLNLESVDADFTSTDGNTIYSRLAVGNFVSDSYAKRYAQPPAGSDGYYWAPFVQPFPGSYKLYVDVHAIVGNLYFNNYALQNQNIRSGFFDSALAWSSGNLVRNSVSVQYYKADSSSEWISGSAEFSLFVVRVDGPSGSAFSGFGGGLTRGGGAGRKYNLIPAAKADSVAVGSGVSRADVLENYALFDEDTNAVSIPQADGTTINYTANTWVYNYETRTYNITTANSTTVYITYGDDKAIVTDGTNPPVDYYYTAPVATDGGGGDDDGDGGFWDTILGGLADGILDFFKAVGVVAASIFEGLVGLLTDLVSSIGQLVGLVGSIGGVIGGFFTFLPPEVQSAISAALIVTITISVIAVIRK